MDNGLCELKVVLRGSCRSDIECADRNSECDGGLCQCKEQFYEHAGVCKPRGIVDAPCLPNNECSQDNTVCEQGFCYCAEGFFLRDSSICVPRIPLFRPCSSDSDICADANAICENEQCQCMEQFYADGGMCYEKGRLGTPCLPGDVCAVLNSVCDATKICVCDEFHFQEEGICGKI